MKHPVGFKVLFCIALVMLSLAFVSAGRADEFVSDNEGAEFTAARGAASKAPSAQFQKYFVTTAWVKSHLNNTIIIDTRDVSSYAAGHIKGAINVPISEFIYSRVEGTDGTTILYMIPTPTEFIEKVNSWGVKNSSTAVVTYGDAVDADWGVSARLAWTFQLFGHKKAYNMDGGFPKFQAEYSKYVSTTAKVPTPNAKSYALTGYSDILATKYDVKAAVDITDTGVVILDSRTPGEYEGTDVKSGNPRSGHIPNAVELTWTNVFKDYTIPGTSTIVKVLKSEEELRTTVFNNLSKDKTIIPYCEGGFRSAHVTFILLGLGYPSVRHYQGSWSEWSRQEPTLYPYRTGLTP